MIDEAITGYWHLYSDGTRADIPFCDDEDKVFAMNLIPICAYQFGMEVICLNVNDTHLHCIIHGKDAEAFRLEMKRRLVRYFKHQQKLHQLKGRFFLACDPISERTELLSKIVYTFRNCLDFYRKAPWEYRWGVGNIFFSDENKPTRGRTIGDLSYRERGRLLHCWEPLPAHWRVDDHGMLLPESYIDSGQVEQLFGSVRAFLAFLYVRKEDEQRMKQQFAQKYLQQRSIQELRETGMAYARNSYKTSLQLLPFEKRLKIAARMIRERVGTRSESLAKALFLQKEDLDRLL